MIANLAARSHSAKKIESAVYGYIRIMQSLGWTRIKTSKIAMALDLPLRSVNSTLASLQKKGVKLVGDE